MDRHDTASRLANAMLRFRRVRERALPSAIFSEPAWEVLLELFVADAEGRRLTAREIGARTGIRPSVMARWLIHLDRCQLIIGDGDGDLDDPLTLSGKGFDAVEQLMVEASDLLRDFALS